jgi:mercuric ion binding protein
MKIIALLSVLLTGLFFSDAHAQETALQTAKIKTSAVCDMCKATIERAVAYEKGVKAVSLDVKSRMLTVSYRPDKTNLDKIRTAVSKTGYDADSVTADPKAYEKIDACCKKENAVH